MPRAEPKLWSNSAHTTLNSFFVCLSIYPSIYLSFSPPFPDWQPQCETDKSWAGLNSCRRRSLRWHRSKTAAAGPQGASLKMNGTLCVSATVPDLALSWPEIYQPCNNDSHLVRLVRLQPNVKKYIYFQLLRNYQRAHPTLLVHLFICSPWPKWTGDVLSLLSLHCSVHVLQPKHGPPYMHKANTHTHLLRQKIGLPNQIPCRPLSPFAKTHFRCISEGPTRSQLCSYSDKWLA